VARAERAEAVRVPDVRARLQALGARYLPPPQSSARYQVFWVGASRKYLRVFRSSAEWATIEWHSTCPCAQGG
jgi:hypothetical protein